jgi:threonine dehydratase
VLTVTGASYADALAASLARQAETGALLMHAYDQREVVIGAGTLAAEVEEEAGVPDRVLVSVGGGGLIAGSRRGSRIDPGSTRWSRSWRRPCIGRGRRAAPVDVAVSGVAADSLGARRIGSIAWEVTQRHVDAAHLLDDAPIRTAQGRPVEDAAPRVEPAAALPLAALTTGDRRAAQGGEVLLVVCGANLDLASLAI